MKKYEVLLREVQYHTVLYTVEARGEKEARRKALREYKYEDPEDKWITGWQLVDGEQVLLVENDSE
jgi:hypothetical protein